MSAELVTSLLLVGLFAAVAVLLSLQGLWTGLVAIPNLLAAAAVATAWHGVVAAWIDGYLGSYTHLLDLLAVWGIFALVMLVLREVTDRVSRHRVAFPPLVERIGSPVAAAVAAWIMVAFTAASIQTAPWPVAAVQRTPESRMLFGIAPDRKWLQFIRGSSAAGPFAAPSSPFDPKADFLVRHSQRRIGLDREAALRVNR